MQNLPRARLIAGHEQLNHIQQYVNLTIFVPFLLFLTRQHDSIHRLSPLPALGTPQNRFDRSCYSVRGVLRSCNSARLRDRVCISRYAPLPSRLNFPDKSLRYRAIQSLAEHMHLPRPAADHASVFLCLRKQSCFVTPSLAAVH